jgi:uncharacterized membrane protein YbhN (UPF0104 family)
MEINGPWRWYSCDLAACPNLISRRHGSKFVDPYMRVGELSRIFFLSGKREALIGIAFVDKAIDLESLLFLASIGCAIAFGITHTIAFSLFAAILLGLILFPEQYISALRRFAHYIPLKQKILLMLTTIEAVSMKLIISYLAIRLITCAVDMIQFGLLIHTFDSVGLKAVLAVYSLVVLVNIFPITIGGIGLREGAAVLLLGHFGISGAAAVTDSFMLFCINTLLTGIIGAFIIGMLREVVPKVKQYR